MELEPNHPLFSAILSAPLSAPAPALPNAPPIPAIRVAYVNHLQPQRNSGSLTAELALLYQFRDRILWDGLLGDGRTNLFAVMASHHVTSMTVMQDLSKLEFVEGPCVKLNPGPPPNPPLEPSFRRPGLITGRWATTREIQAQAIWSQYDRDHAAYERCLQQWRTSEAEYQQYLLLQSRPHTTVSVGYRSPQSTGRGHPHATFHIFSYDNNPRNGLETYCFIRRRTSEGMTRSYTLQEAMGNCVGMVAADGRILPLPH